MIYLYIGIAGAFGAMSRYLIGLFLFTQAVFPFATLFVNLAGCYMLAYLTSTVFHKNWISANFKTAIGTGFLGSFTTFSAFSLETIQLFQDERVFLAILYIFISMVGGNLMWNLGLKKEVVG